LDRDADRGKAIAAEPGERRVAYGSAKARIIGMTLIAARDLASVGIRANGIAPGTMGTRAWGAAPAELRKSFEDNVPFRGGSGGPTSSHLSWRTSPPTTTSTCTLSGSTARSGSDRGD
jgi:NAD(P)-dependent dehydrogenase (short-subunit alcohol dehydrogenase family)